MFHSARIKLTACYLLIIMIVSVSFSFVVYRLLTNELDRIERNQEIRNNHLFPDINVPPRFVYLDPQVIQETKERLETFLIFINLGILGVSTAAGYFLAGQTLKPIKDMVDDQNRFISDASHELRTPLTSLKTEIEVNLRDKNLDLKEAKKILQSNLEEVNHLQNLSNNLIKLNNNQSTHHLDLKLNPLLPVVEDAIKKIRPQALVKKIKIENKIKNTILKIDSSAITEVFVILLDNAIKYSPKNTKIILNSKIFDNSILIKVIDQGIGINPKDLSHIFDRFFRADQSRTKTEIPGYGLGLSIAKQIVNRHHGTITAASQLNQGSTFTINLPIKPSSK